MTEQLILNLPVRTALGREDFFVAPSNAMAVAMLDNWRHWPAGKLLLTGPEGAGKTHLAHVWAQTTGARILSADRPTPEQVPDLVTGPVAIEDVPRIAGDANAQRALFHLHNLMRAEAQPLLLTARGTASHWTMSLPDLQSRLQGTQQIALDLPDDNLLGAVLAKLFADRGLIPRADVIPYLVTRIDRSFEAAAQVVDHLDRVALREGRALSRGFAARVLPEIAALRD